MLLRYSWKREDAAQIIERAVDTVLAEGIKTADLCLEGEQAVSTFAFAEAVADEIGVK